ncbi:MAG: EAL domain-containing protein [Sphingomonadales bacterium]
MNKQLRAGEAPSLLSRYSAEMQRVNSHHQADTQASETRLERLDALMRRIVEANFDGILTVHPDGRLGMANKSASDMFGYSVHQMMNMTLDELLPGFRSFTDTRSEDYCIGQGHKETIGVRSDGSGFPVDLCLSETLFGSSRIVIAIVRDITETKEHRRQLEHQAMHDALTGLPNRVLLNDRLDQALHAAKRSGEPVALLLLDLDNFKEINDTLGHHIGDMLLVELGQRLVKPLRGSDTVARLGGDEFAILLPLSGDEAAAMEIASRVRKSILRPFTVLEGLDLEVGVSIGIALSPDHAKESSKLMQCADIAMYNAKAGSSKIVLYDENSDTSNIRHLTLTGELRQAIEGDELEVAYQPIIDLTTGKIHAVEALARWTHPRLGQIHPGEFIAQAERTGMIQPLTARILDASLRQMRKWGEQNHDFSVCLNISPRILHDAHFPMALQGVVDEYGLITQRLTLEITETAIFFDPDNAMRILNQLRELGFQIAIDDFGTGYSSLSYLQKMPLDELKIDQSFIREIHTNPADAVIVRSTIELAHNLGLKVVAEGIEEPDHIGLLQEMNCDFAQGYFFSKPQSGEDISSWLANGHHDVEKAMATR